MTRRLVLLVMALAPALIPALLASGASAEPATPLPPAEKQSLDAFAAANTGCREWSDGCVICVRQDKAAFACSTPGIACTPSHLACSPAPVPKDKP